MINLANKKYIYVNGCSHSCGYELECPESYRTFNNLNNSWAGQLAKHYNLTHLNYAIPGQCNQTIVSNTINHLLNSLDKIDVSRLLVVIGWSSIDRSYSVIDDKLYRLLPGADKKYLKFYNPIIVDTFKNYILTLDSNQNLINYSNHYYNLVNFLNQHNIDYVFFNSIDSHQKPSRDITNELDSNRYNLKLYDIISSDTNYYYPMTSDKTFYNQLKQLFDDTVDGRNHHFTKPAHDYWAKIMIDFIDSIQDK